MIHKMVLYNMQYIVYSDVCYKLFVFHSNGR